jgi:hypothetical protein
MKYNILILLLFLSSKSFSQDWTLPFSSTIVKSEKELQGATVSLIQGSKQITQTITGEDGIFKFKIPANGDFTIIVTKIGHCTKKLQVSTKGVPADRSNDDFSGFNIESISLFEPLPDIDYSILNQALVKVSYNPKSDNFDYDESYSNQMLGALEKLKQLELAAIARQKEIEVNYLSALKTADKAFKKKDWVTAKTSYNEAIKVKPTELYPKNQLLQIDIIIKDQDALNKKREADKLNEEVKKETANNKATTDKLSPEKIEVADKVTKENSTKENLTNKSATDRIKEKTETNILQDLVQEKYRVAKDKADALFLAKKYQEARTAYEDALIVKAGDLYAKGRLADIEKILKSDYATAANIDVKQKLLRDKYSPGVTEETIVGKGVVILQRVVVKSDYAYVYQKKSFSWGGISYFRDSKAITESTFDQETNP